MWLVQAILGTISISCMYLIFKKLTSQGVSPAVLLLYFFTFGAVFYLAHVLVTKSSYNISSHLLPLLIAAAAFGYLGNYFYTSSIEIAPNPGYTLAIGAMQIVIVTLASVSLFGSDLSTVNLLGISLAVVSVVLISL